MIIFDLKCAPKGHVFEAWFGSGGDFDDQQARGLVCCPICGSEEVGKAPMAPRLGSGSDLGPEMSPGAVKALLAQIAVMQRQALEKGDYVGERFPDEARAIHLGEAEARAIHGKASRADAESLLDEGIPVSPLLFPLAEPGEEN